MNDLFKIANSELVTNCIDLERIDKHDILENSRYRCGDIVNSLRNRKVLNRKYDLVDEESYVVIETINRIIKSEV